jgi:DNA-binding Xre family transcriptional regulator
MSTVVDIDVMLARRKMTVVALADRIGITPANLAVLKNGRAKAVRFTTLEAFCSVLECQPGDLLRWAPDIPDKDDLDIQLRSDAPAVTGSKSGIARAAAGSPAADRGRQTGRMSKLDEVGERDGWTCWICDEPVDSSKSVNDVRGPSVDSVLSSAKSAKAARGKAPSDGTERLAHRGCNTKKGAVTAVIAWPSRLFVSDPAPLIGVAERLERKGGREVVARCPTRADADETADWLLDRFSRLSPTLAVSASVEPGGGQFMVALAVQGRR